MSPLGGDPEDSAGESARASAAGSSLDDATAALVRFSARIAAGSEASMRTGAEECLAAATPSLWVEELLLQAYLFCGFPRALNATREWRRVSGVTAPASDVAQGAEGSTIEEWRAAGEATCAIVYGEFYEKLRRNIVTLHPALDEWMIVEGYGKILSRPGLDLARRELCIVAACVAAGQDRQLHSHLHGARNAGAPPAGIRAALGELRDIVSADDLHRAQLLLARVLGKN